MLMEGWVKFFSPQNAVVWVSQEKGVAVMSQTMAVNGDQFWNINETLKKNIKFLHTGRLR